MERSGDRQGGGKLLTDRIVTNKWRGGEQDDAWTVEIKDDIFDEDGEFVVTIVIQNHDDGERTSYSLAAATPGQAREMANAPHVYAFFANKANRDRGERAVNQWAN